MQPQNGELNEIEIELCNYLQHLRIELSSISKHEFSKYIQSILNQCCDFLRSIKPLSEELLQNPSLIEDFVTNIKPIHLQITSNDSQINALSKDVLHTFPTKEHCVELIQYTSESCILIEQMIHNLSEKEVYELSKSIRQTIDQLLSYSLKYLLYTNPTQYRALEEAYATKKRELKEERKERFKIIEESTVNNIATQRRRKQEKRRRAACAKLRAYVSEHYIIFTILGIYLIPALLCSLPTILLLGTPLIILSHYSQTVAEFLTDTIDNLLELLLLGILLAQVVYQHGMPLLLGHYELFMKLLHEKGLVHLVLSMMRTFVDLHIYAVTQFLRIMKELLWMLWT